MKTSTTFKATAGVLAALTVAGVAAWIYQLVNGLGVTGMSNSTSWGLYITCFMFFVGLSAGGLIVASSASVFHVAEYKKVAADETAGSADGSADAALAPGTYVEHEAIAVFTKQFAKELAEYDIRVNAFGPGTTKTRMSEPTRLNPHMNEQFLNDIPMHRYGEVKEAVDAALFLASEESSFMLGEIVFEDGGQSL